LVLHHALGRSVERVATGTGSSIPTVQRRLTHGAWALADHHPGALTIPRAGAAWPWSAGSVTTSPVERWAAAELAALRLEVAAGCGHAQAPRARRATMPSRRAVGRAVVTVGAVLVIAVVGAAWSDLSRPAAPPRWPSSVPTPSATVSDDVVARTPSR
jgi:hypothetical protein